MMKDEYYWNKFKKTGSINDYLSYACTSEESVNLNRIPTHFSRCVSNGFTAGINESRNIGREEGGVGDEPGNGNRYGTIGHADGRFR